MKKEELHHLFQLNIQEGAPDFLIYSDQITGRLSYVVKFIFKNVLNCNYSITDNLQVFKNSGSVKINYANGPIPKTFQIKPHPLIFENGISNTYLPKGELIENLIHFHSNSDGCNLGFDIFSSVFYFISRYQEWQPFEGDIHGRFETINCIQYKFEVHLKPLVNIWIEEFKTRLCDFYSALKFPEKKFRYISTIDVDNLYAFKNKGHKRTIAAIVRDIVTFNFKNLNRRISVLKNKLSDPFDVYDNLNVVSKKTQHSLIYFFLQRSDTKFDRTIDPSGGAFEPVFEKIKNAQILFGLHPSYYTGNDERLMRSEFEIMNEHSASQINISRQHYLRFDIRKTPFQLIKNNVLADFTMGFASSPGYRAATFTPFYFYDFENENQTDLLMVPFAVMDGVFFVYSNSGIDQAETQIMQIADEAKRLKGILVSVFHERTFDDVLYPGFGDMYYKLQEKL